MREHIFLQDGRIEEADLHEILALSAVGELEWGWAGGGVAAVGSNVEYSMGAEYALHHNLIEVRAGFMPSLDNAFNYLRMHNFHNRLHYVEHDADDPLMPLAKRVLRVGMLAVTAERGRMSGTMQYCVECEQETGHAAVYDSPYGIAGAVMAGSERVECVTCGHTI